MTYSDRIGQGLNLSSDLYNTTTRINHLRQDFRQHELRSGPHFRSHSEPLGNNSINAATQGQRPFTADNEVTHISDSDDDIELLPLSTTSQSTYQTKLNSVLPTFTMDDNYFHNDGGSGTIESQLSNENFHCVDFASGSDERYCASGANEIAAGGDARKLNSCSSSLSDSGAFSGVQRDVGINSELVEVSDDSDDDVILMEYEQSVPENRSSSSSGINSELERNIGLYEDDTTEELDRAQILNDVTDWGILSPIHDQVFDPREIEGCSTPVNKTLIKREHKNDVCGGELESASSTTLGYVKQELTFRKDKEVKVESNQTEMIKDENFGLRLDKFKQECLTKGILLKGVGTKQLKQEEVRQAFAVFKKEDVKGPSCLNEKRELENSKEEDAVEQEQPKDVPSNSRDGTKSPGQENKQPVMKTRVMKRKRLASKPLSAIINMPKTRVGLSKRIKVDPLHNKIKKRS
ncbi:hypothetical protein CANMA_002494 [Candida margitis]|uniref:uncharacterized protein n=1 Tax=Candida margitis TaxID=1775924 RepID=UPI00222636D8|nr:uncharacterized protein CANMA_002494 [Candida margitis]KAI5968278.1 hypothetical protein CANMA_002494 [Candida margitis]